MFVVIAHSIEVRGLVKKSLKFGNKDSKMDGFTPPKINMVHLKMKPWKRRFLLKTIIFRFHVNLRGCRLTQGYWKNKNISYPQMGVKNGDEYHGFRIRKKAPTKRIQASVC